MKLNLVTELQTVKREIKTLTKKLDKLITTAGKLEKGSPVKTKTVKTAPAKGKVSTSRSTVKKTDMLSAADTVWEFIKRAKKSLDTDALMKKTGYNRKKIANIVYKLKAQGKIKSTDKGLYSKA